MSAFETGQIPWAGIAFGAVCSWMLLRPVVAYFQDPLNLRRFPAPNLLAAISVLWLVKETWLERRSRTLHKQLQEKGDVLRVGPNQIIFNSAEAVADIYGHKNARKVVKDVFYDKVAGDEHDIVNTRDHDDHGQRRKYLANAFAQRTIAEMEPVIHTNFGRLLRAIDAFVDRYEASPDEGFDIRKWLNFFTLDVIGDMAFGIPMGFVQNGSDKKQAQTQTGHFYEVPATIDCLQQGVRYTLTLAQAVSLQTVQRTKEIVNRVLWLKKWIRAQDADDFENICINQLRTRLGNGPTRRTNGDLFTKVLEDRDGIARPIAFRQLVAESIVFMNAGSDTTAAGLSSTLYYLISNKRCLTRLREEVETRISLSDEREIVPYSLVRDLPYLRACIDEALRLRPPIAYALQRLVTAPEGVTIAGHHISQGTVVAVSPYSVHRKDNDFPQADMYMPERWLDSTNPDQIRNLKASNIVFSQGPRQCLGRHIAIIELQILIATLTRNYNIELMHEGQELLIFDRFNANPGPLPVTISRRTQQGGA